MKKFIIITFYRWHLTSIAEMIENRTGAVGLPLHIAANKKNMDWLGKIIYSRLFLPILFTTIFLSYRAYENRNVPGMTREPTIVERNMQYFSRWDGSNPELVEYVKSRMNDPNSFEHVETVPYEYEGGGELRIVMTYRGKNAFGGVITNKIVADFQKSTRTIINADY